MDDDQVSLRRSVLVAAVAAAGPGIVAQTRSFVPVTAATLANPDPGDWLHISRTHDQQRFSPLTQINKGNVAQLRMAWSRGLPVGVQESTPIVYRGVIRHGSRRQRAALTRPTAT